MKHLKILTLIATIIFFIIACNNGIKYPAGGYDYPSRLSANDTTHYFLPISNLIPRKDSFLYAGDYKIYKSYDEPNLSLKPNKEDIFRLTYECGLMSPIIVTITQEKIIIKKRKSGSPYPEEDESKLTELEKIHFHILTRNYPLNREDFSPPKKHYLDSMTKVYPQLLDSRYYGYLRSKVLKTKNNFMYDIKIIPITNSIFSSLINQINSSGYWKLPYRMICEDYPNDGCGFTFEANTRNKYNIVSVPVCSSDTTKFAKACQKIVNYAQMNKSIQLLWKDEVDTAK